MQVVPNQDGWEVELFRLFVENSNDYAIFVIDLEGRVLTWNPGAERVLGYQHHEIVGQSSFILFTPEDRASGIPDKELQLALRDGRATDDRWHLARNGNRLWVTGVMTLLTDEDGNPRAYAKVMRDFTEAKLAADALRESEGRLRVALEAAEMGTWLWRIPADEQILDDSLRKLMGLRPEQTVLTLDDFLQAVHPEDSERVKIEFEQCLQTRNDFNVEFRVRWPDGSLHWLRDQGKAFFDEHDRPLFMTGACIDITIRKHDEDKLREADRRKDEFLAVLAHELRNPLAPLRNGLELMRIVADTNLIDETRSMMERQLNHMVRLIDDLLDMSRLNQSKLHLKRTQISLTDIINNSVESARPAIESSRHQLDVLLPEEPVLLEGDLTRLAQVFSNLLTNSAKYTRPGGRITLSARLVNTAVEVSVHDNGIGIPGDALPHIFDMFSQVDRSLERSAGGLGIGLALVKRLVEMHGGQIVATSEGVGQGSTFIVTLPTSKINSSPAEGNLAEDELKVALSRYRKILVVDDNRDSATSMASLLRMLGSEVVTAHDGFEAVDSAKKWHPDLVLMDVGMPRLNGYDATAQIRKEPWGRRTIIVATTGWGQEGDRERSRAAGCNGHLVKPVNLTDLGKLVNKLQANAK